MKCADCGSELSAIETLKEFCGECKYNNPESEDDEDDYSDDMYLHDLDMGDR